MEFERALFRIHQRTIYSESVKQARFQAERALPWAVAALAVCLGLLHADYVGQAHCLPAALEHAGFWNATTSAPNFPQDALLRLVVVEGDELLDMRLRMTDPGPSSAARDSVLVQGGGIGLAAENATAPGFGVQRLDHRRAIASYRFALDREVILMRQSMFESHNFKAHNLTLPERCLAPSRVLGDFFRLLDAFDGIVINELAYTFRSRGYLERVVGGYGRGWAQEIESWAWSAEQVESASPRDGRPLWASAVRKLLLLVKSTITVLLISSLTGFFIRVAVNGSAVLMFPIAVASQAMGTSSGRMSMGVLTRSFPWIGVHVEVLRRAGRPLWPLFRSHLVFLFLQSFAYLSCNLAWRFILYRKSSPEGFEERVFSFCSVLELYNLIFVRSASSTAVFPKLAFACMVWLHFYVFCSLYPFHSLALAMCGAACTYVMVYCINHFEEPALRADPFSPSTPTAAHPRALYMPQLSPSWTLESAPLWTMFYPPEPPSAYGEEAMRHISNEEYLMA